MLIIIINLIIRWGRFFTIGFAKTDFDCFVFGLIGFFILIGGSIYVWNDGRNKEYNEKDLTKK